MAAAQNVRGALLALAAMGIFATHDVVVKVLGGVYAPIQVIFFASLLGFPILTLPLLGDAKSGSLRPRHPGWAAARTLLSVVATIAVFYAFATLPLAQVYAILFSTPLLITILSVPFLGEQVRARRWAAVATGLAGVLIVLRPGAAALSLGHGAALAAAVCGAMIALIVRKVGRDERAVVLLIYPMLGNFVVAGLALPFFYLPMPLADLGLTGVIAVLGTLAGWLVILAYREGEAAVVAPMQYSQILWATAYGSLLFDESLDGPTVLGASVIIASGLYIVLRESRAGAASHRPVTEARARGETATAPRARALQRLFAARRGG